MRAKVAAHAGGHAFEKRFLELDGIQLLILHKHALEEEQKKRKETADLIRALNELWTNNFKVLFKDLHFFVNPTMYKKLQDLKDTTNNAKEVDRSFEKDWEDIMSVMPKQVEGVLHEYEYSGGRDANPEVDEMLAGWIPYPKRRGDAT